MIFSGKHKVEPRTKKNPVVAAIFHAGQSPAPPVFVPTSYHPFYAGFRVVGLFHRLAGCCFLENLASAHYGGVRASRASRYFLYPLGAWIYLLKALLNNVLLMYRAPELVELLRLFGLVDRLIGPPQYVQREAVKFAWKLIACQAAHTILNVSMNIYSDFGTVILVQKGRKMAPAIMGIVISYGFIGVTFLTLNCVSTRLLLAYTSRATSLYVSCLVKNVDRCLRSWRAQDSRYGAS
ncbi:hypothetical protein HPB50_029273 [Hyalomma asiaticum]|nr:hypothetical protein HPB50_029273 [Hyalomma asiaticum]